MSSRTTAQFLFSPLCQCRMLHTCCKAYQNSADVSGAGEKAIAAPLVPDPDEAHASAGKGNSEQSRDKGREKNGAGAVLLTISWPLPEPDMPT